MGIFTSLLWLHNLDALTVHQLYLPLMDMFRLEFKLDLEMGMNIMYVCPVDEVQRKDKLI